MKAEFKIGDKVGVIIMKLHKQSSGVGKYLKWVKEKLTGGNLPNINQQLQEYVPCKKIHGCKVDPETRFRYCTSLHFACYRARSSVR